ncbi:hypothetical protein LguiB_010630 [Lonicera macranthoides]
MDCGIESMGLIVLSFIVFLKFFKLRRIESITTTTAAAAAASGTTSSASVSESESESESELESASDPARREPAAKYDVFLSFRGHDTRKTFNDLLYYVLLEAGIRVFRGSGEFRRGPGPLEVIRGCKISIPIFSKSYAHSKWCLEELTNMVECHTNMGQMIFPIFYNIKPSDVRLQRGSYEEAFRRHKKRFDEKTVQQWKVALKIVGELRGWDLERETDGYFTSPYLFFSSHFFYKESLAFSSPLLFLDMDF